MYAGSDVSSEARNGRTYPETPSSTTSHAHTDNGRDATTGADSQSLGGPGQTGDMARLVDMSAERRSDQPANSMTDMSPMEIGSHEDANLSKKKTQEGLKIIIISSIIFAVSVTIALVLTIFLGPPAVIPHGAVACDAQECADIGTEMLKLGGSAVDAAIATTLCLGVVNPHHSGIGGGLFMVIRDHKENKSLTINARETAPSTASEDQYPDPDMIKIGSLAVGIPGELRGLQAAHEQYGSLSWATLVKPAAQKAREGFAVSAALAHAIQSTELEGGLRQLFYSEDDQPIRAGDTLQLTGLANVLDTVAEQGVDGFYETYSQEISDATDGQVPVQDLLDYSVVTGETLKGQIDGLTVETVPAPGGGPLLLFILNVMQGYGLSRQNLSEPLYYHRLLETLMFTEAEKTKFGDPSFVDSVDNLTQLITSESYAGFIRGLISDDQTKNSQYYLDSVSGGGDATPDSGTAQVSVLGPNEDFVSVTSTINMYFGSHIVTKSGIILNNQMADFTLPLENDDDSSIEVSPSNRVAAGKRPRSSMSPTIVHHHGKPCAPRLALGGVNGSRIISGVAEVLLNMFGFHMNLTDAVEMARLYASITPRYVEYDRDFDPAILSKLEDDYGHTNFVDASSKGLSFVHAAAKVNESVTAYADSREEDSGASVY